MPEMVAGPTVEPGTLDRTQLAARLGVSLRQFNRLNALGVLPKPMPWPGHPRWSVATVDRYLADPHAVVGGLRDSKPGRKGRA